jgi:hypothetical protein
LTVDPYKYFHSLTETEQDRLFDRNDAQAIRNGADIYRVVNIRDVGLAKPRNGRLGWQARRYGTPSKLTIDDIYTAADADRDLAMRLMRENGSSPGSRSLGGTSSATCPTISPPGSSAVAAPAKGATLAYRKAVASGVRDPLEPATQTAAERRLHTAVLMKQAVDRGSNPFAVNTCTEPSDSAGAVPRGPALEQIARSNSGSSPASSGSSRPYLMRRSSLEESQIQHRHRSRPQSFGFVPVAPVRSLGRRHSVRSDTIVGYSFDGVLPANACR